MSQKTLRIFVISIAAGVLLLLFSVGRVRPSDRLQVDKSRALKVETKFSVETLLAEAKKTLDPKQGAVIAELESKLQFASDTARVELFKELSSFWNQTGNFAVGGHYAEQLAQATSTEEAWSIAGTTYSIGYQRLSEAGIRKFCVQKAIECFEKAIQINPNDYRHELNLALAYVETEQPMQGIMKLQELEKKDPTNEAVQMALGRLSLRSGQFDKAIERFQKVVQLDPSIAIAYFQLGKAYEEIGDKFKAIENYKKFIQQSADEKANAEVEKIINALE